jgi:hypothetical protein
VGDLVKVHALKTDAEMWWAVGFGKKTAEFRRDDRGFAVGDTLELLFEHGGADVKPIYCRITHIDEVPQSREGVADAE